MMPLSRSPLFTGSLPGFGGLDHLIGDIAIVSVHAHRHPNSEENDTRRTDPCREDASDKYVDDDMVIPRMLKAADLMSFDLTQCVSLLYRAQMPQELPRLQMSPWNEF